MSSKLSTLFPFLGLIFTLILFVSFLVLNKKGRTPVKKPVKTKAPKNTDPEIQEIYTTPVKEGYTPPVKEGFFNIAKPKTFPKYNGAAIRFGLTQNDAAYQVYAHENLQPTPELLSYLNSLPIEETPLPNYGASLGTFDSSELTAIPWDADNKDYAEKDIVWGTVSEGASRSIFMKVYHQNLMADAANLTETSSGYTYRSPILAVSASDPATGYALLTFDTAASAVGQLGLDHALEVIKKKVFNSVGAQAAEKAGLKAEYAAAKLAGEAAGPLEKALIKQFETRFNLVKSVLGKVEKGVRKLGSAMKTLLGIKPALAAAKRIASKMGAKLGAKLAAATGKMTALHVITGLLDSMEAVCDVAAVASFGALAPLAIIITILVSLWNVLDGICMFVMIALMVILPSLLDKALENGGLCTSGKTIEELIPDEFLYFLFTTFIPIGGVLDAFGPYLCYNTDGSCHLKDPLFIPPYYADATLSSYKHVYDKEHTARGSIISYTDAADSIPQGWTVTAGIAREPCAPGTWTSSDVDMLCNISTYVPRTYPKGSMVPATTIKLSRIPRTYAKETKVRTRIKTIKWMGSSVPSYAPCSTWYDDYRDDALGGLAGTCWGKSGQVCADNCAAGWDNCKYAWTDKACCNSWSGAICTGWGCPVCTGGCITTCSSTYIDVNNSHGPIERERCPDGWDKYLSLCREACPKGMHRVSRTDLTCFADACDADEDTYLDLFCVKRNCPDGWTDVVGICWKQCGRDIDVGALCRENCSATEYEVLGVCWTACRPDQVDVGALCRDACTGSTPHDIAGVCWGDCGNDIDVKALCRENCKDGFHEVAGVCWGNQGTYARASMIPKSIKTFDDGFQPPGGPSLEKPPQTLSNTDGTTIEICDYGSEEMLNRMGQFYYDKSILNPIILDDGRISFEYIYMFYGLIASSELSCDVACGMRTVKFDPITGDRYEENDGTTYPEDPGNSVSFRRFYFVKIDSVTAGISGRPVDTTGIFTVSGCTNSDYTAPDAMSKSTDQGVDPVVSLPKIFEVLDKRGNSNIWDQTTFTNSLAVTAVSVGPGLIGGFGGGRRSAAAGAAGGIVGGIGGAIAGKALSDRLAAMAPIPVGIAAENSVIGTTTASLDKLFVSTNNNNYTINHGPIYEYRAKNDSGYEPTITFCTNVITSQKLCTHELVLRDTINLYHSLNPSIHVKTVNVIEARGRDGCYYNWDETTYDAATNVEGAASVKKEVVLKYTIPDQSTCVFAPTQTFVTNMTDYPIRSYTDPLKTTKLIYPTRNIQSTPQFQGRYIRVRPSQTSDGYLNLSQIVVYDNLGTNLALNKPVYATSTTAAVPNVVVNGKLSAQTDPTKMWQSTAGVQSEYWEVDLGKNYMISSVLYMGTTTTTARNMGVRIQILYTNQPAATPVVEKTTVTQVAVQTINFATETAVPKDPASPFNIPQPLPNETTMGGAACPTRCQDTTQINSLVEQYNANAANSSSKIIKVLKAVTPTSTRCDYEVEMLRTDTTGNSTVGKEKISMTIGTPVTTEGGVVYGRFIRVRPPLTAGDGSLQISQIVVKDATGTNIALGSSVYATSTDATYLQPSVVTDGTITLRTPAWKASTATRSTEFLEIDLKRLQSISSIVFYGSPNGVRIQVLTENSTISIPVFENTLSGSISPQTVLYNKCTFTYTPNTSTTSFIQSNTPTLAASDSSGGIFTFKNIISGIQGMFNTIINPIKSSNPLATLTTNVKAADDTAKAIVTTIGASQQLTGCPTVKCSDPAVLDAIANRYNTDNSIVSGIEYGAETHKMTAIAKAGIAGPNTCDIMFNDLYEQYDDVLYDPVVSQNSTKVTRFTMTNTGSCTFQVAAGATSITDVSMNAIGIMSSAANLVSPYSPTPCIVNCRDLTILRSVKQALETKYSTPNIINTFKTVTQSFNTGSSTCEYMMQKDISTKNTVLNTFPVSDAGVDTYVSATFTKAAAACTFTLSTVMEYLPDNITTVPDSKGTDIFYLNGTQVILPFLYNYDNTTPSRRVNEQVQILS